MSSRVKIHKHPSHGTLHVYSKGIIRAHRTRCSQLLCACLGQRDGLLSLQWYRESNRILVYRYTGIRGLQIVYRGLQGRIQVYRSTESLQNVYRYHTCAVKQDAEAQQTAKHKNVHHVVVALPVAQPSVSSDLLHSVYTCKQVFEPRSCAHAATAAPNSQPAWFEPPTKKFASAVLPFDRQWFDSDELPRYFDPSDF